METVRHKAFTVLRWCLVSNLKNQHRRVKLFEICLPSPRHLLLISKLNEQVKTVGKHLQLSGHPWLNETSIFVGTPKVGIVGIHFVVAVFTEY